MLREFCNGPEAKPKILSSSLTIPYIVGLSSFDSAWGEAVATGNHLMIVFQSANGAFGPWLLCVYMPLSFVCGA